MKFAGGCRICIVRSVLLACFTMLASAFAATPASADFRVCNATQSLVGVAIGYRAKEGWKTEGWWNIEASSCQTLIEGSLGSRFYYLYAEDGERGGRWDGPISMCIAERPFKIDGVNDCFQRGFQKAGFREYDTGTQASWMVQLTDEPSGAQTPAPTTPAAPTEPPAAPGDDQPADGAPVDGAPADGAPADNAPAPASPAPAGGNSTPTP